jgi:hypothetical protein
MPIINTDPDKLDRAELHEQGYFCARPWMLAYVLARLRGLRQGGTRPSAEPAQ